ncbi:MAG: hypothetical protein RL722_2964, partial [Pseudomonadota bacterium]
RHAGRPQSAAWMQLPAGTFRPLAVLPMVLAAIFICGPAARAAPALIEDSLAQRLVACTVCHGASDRRAADAYRPRLAGKPAGYLLHQLLNFRDGRRHYGPMVALVEGLPEPWLREIADHFATLDLPHQPLPGSGEPLPAALAERGRRLALEGDVTRRIPACASCHGPRLTGVQPATPGLLGLPRDYLVGQLGAWRSGERQALAPDCMAEVVRGLSAEDVAAVTAWLASQPQPQPYRPEAGLDRPAPLHCGSVVNSIARPAPAASSTGARP